MTDSLGGLLLGYIFSILDEFIENMGIIESNKK
jgi:hypothetical protein